MFFWNAVDLARGAPFAWQERNDHDLLVDLRDEIEVMEYTIHMAELLDNIVLAGKSVIEDSRIIYAQLRQAARIPTEAAEAGLAYLDDRESVL